MHKRSELFFSLFLIPIDFLASLLAFVLAYIIRVKIIERPIVYPIKALLFLKIFLLILPMWIIIFALVGLYDFSRLRGRFIEEMSRIFIAVSAGTMFLIFIDYISKQPIFPAKAIPIYGYILALILLIIIRYIYRLIRHYLYRFNIGVRRILIIGDGENAKKIIISLINTCKTGYYIHGIIGKTNNAIELSKQFKIKIYQNFVNAINSIGNSNIDEIIQADLTSAKEAISTIQIAENNHIYYRFIPSQFGLFTTNSSVSIINQIPIVDIKKTPLEGWGRIIKRIFDITTVLIGIIISLPLLLVIFISIKISDPGPALYWQNRISRLGKRIRIYKFRTMYVKYCTGEQYSNKTDKDILAQELKLPSLAKKLHKYRKLKNDPRLTPIGKILRKTSIDELPQLFNILKGDMSLVGPRPILESELKRYGKSISMYSALRPGLTGLWQVSGRNDISYEERIKLDIYYIENWNLLMDLKILVKTFKVLLSRKGAY